MNNIKYEYYDALLAPSEDALYIRYKITPAPQQPYDADFVKLIQKELNSLREMKRMWDDYRFTDWANHTQELLAIIDNLRNDK